MHHLPDAELHQHHAYEKPQEEATQIGVAVTCGAYVITLYEFHQLSHNHIILSP